MKIFSTFPTVNISKLFLFVLCIAKNFIWTTVKAIFFAPSDSRFSNSCMSAKYCPYKPYINGKCIYSAFKLCINLNLEKCTLMTGFVVQGHILFESIFTSPNINKEIHGLFVCLYLSFSTGFFISKV